MSPIALDSGNLIHFQIERNASLQRKKEREEREKERGKQGERETEKQRKTCRKTERELREGGKFNSIKCLKQLQPTYLRYTFT